MQQKLNNGFLFGRGKILLALSLLFIRASSACTMMEGGESDVAMFC